MKNRNQDVLVKQTRSMIQQQIQLTEQRASIHVMSLNLCNNLAEQESLDIIAQCQYKLQVLYYMLEKLERNNVIKIIKCLNNEGKYDCIKKVLEGKLERKLEC